MTSVFNRISSSTNDDDEEIIEFLLHRNRPRYFQNRINHIDKWNDIDFFRRFRMKKSTFMYILGKIENKLSTLTLRKTNITPMHKLLVTLRFYATGNFVITAGELIGISEPSACRIIQQVTHALAALRPEYIKMPQNEEEIRKVSYHFYKIAKMPRVIGAIDCTHVRINSPGGENAEYFRNRKGYFSLNVQTVAAANLKILDIVVRWPGSVHDQTIFINSKLKTDLENGQFGNHLLVADSGYANTQHVVTPLLQTSNRIEEIYNESLIRTRNVVERQYGVWKRRFPILSFGFRTKLDTTMAAIVACAVLFNITCELDGEEPPDDYEVRNSEDLQEKHPQILIGNNNDRFTARNRILNDYFPSLLANSI